MNDKFKILLADRNRHVRDLLQRELRAEGYKVHVAKNDREVLSMIHDHEPPDLLILDPEIPYMNGETLLEQLLSQKPSLPVVVHTFLMEYESLAAVRNTVIFAKKTGNTDRLKIIVGEVLRKYYRQRFADQRETPLMDTKEHHEAE